MAFGFGGSKSSSKSISKFDQEIAPEQVPFLEQLWGGAGDLFGNTLNQFGGVQPGVSGDMSQVFQQMMPFWQQQMGGGAYSDVNAGDIIRGINTSIGQPTQTGQLYRDIMGGQGNVYLGGMEDMLRRQEGDVLADQMRGLDQRAAAAGVSGGSPYRNLQQNLMEESGQRLGDRMGMLGYNTFDKDLDRKLDIAGMADSNTLARQQMLVDMLGQKQGTMTGGLGFGQQMYGMPMGQYSPFMMPWQAMGQYANTLGPPTILGHGFSYGKGSSGGLSFGFG